VTRGPRRCHPPRQPLPDLLHGEQYYEIHYSYTNEPDTLRQSRIAHDYIYPNPPEGDDVLIEAILNIITEIKKKG
jgi:hypothetical protein